MRYNWKCYVDFLKGCLKGRSFKWERCPFCPSVAGNTNVRAGASAAILEQRGLCMEAMGSDDIAEAEPCC